MADNTQLNTGTGGDVIATDDIAGVKHQLIKVEYGDPDSATQVSPTNPLPVTIPDGKDVNAGTTTDAAVTSDIASTLSAKLRRLVNIFNAIFAGDRIQVGVVADITKTIGQVNGHAFSEDTFGPTNLINQNEGLSVGSPMGLAGGAVVFAITGTWTGTISFLGSTQEGSTTAISAVNLATGVASTTTTVNGKYRLSSGGLLNITARLTTVGTGTAVVEARTSQIHSGNISLDQPLPTGSNVIGQVTANAGTNLNTSALALEAGNLASIKIDVDKIPADPAREGGNLASIKTDVDKIPADPAREGGVLAKDASLTTVNTNLTTIDTDIKATQPRDVTDRSARLLGHVTVDSLPATDVTDRAARLLGIINLLEDALLYGATADATVKPGDSRNSAVRVSNLPDRRLQEENDIVLLNTMYRSMTSRQYDRFSSMDRRYLTTQRGNAR